MRRGPASGSRARSWSSVSWSRLPGPCPPGTTRTRRCQLSIRSAAGPLSARSIDGTGRRGWPGAGGCATPDPGVAGCGTPDAGVAGFAGTGGAGEVIGAVAADPADAEPAGLEAPGEGASPVLAVALGAGRSAAGTGRSAAGTGRRAARAGRSAVSVSAGFAADVDDGVAVADDAAAATGVAPGAAVPGAGGCGPRAGVWGPPAGHCGLRPAGCGLRGSCRLQGSCGPGTGSCGPGTEACRPGTGACGLVPSLVGPETPRCWPGAAGGSARGGRAPVTAPEAGAPGPLRRAGRPQSGTPTGPCCFSCVSCETSMGGAIGSGPVAGPLGAPDAARAAGGGPPLTAGRAACGPPEPGAAAAGPRST